MNAAVDYKKKYEEAVVEISLLKHQLHQLQKMIFGSKSERFVPDQHSSSQLSMDMAVDAAARCSVIDAKKISYTKLTTKITPTPSAHTGRMKLPEHLERRKTVIEPEDDTEGLRRVGEEITEELEWEPGNLFVNQIIRPKYVKADSSSFVIAPMIERPLPKAIAGPGLLAQIVIDKYIDHLPLHRQMGRFKRAGINIPYSTITDWVSGTCKLITPLYGALKKQILQSDYLHADESPIKVLDKDKTGGRHQGYYWVYNNSIERMVLFEYRPGRGQEHPKELLKDFRGYLQTDGYVGYEPFKKMEGVTVLHCLAHARRYFYDALDNDKARAEYALEQFGKLYDIERQAKEQYLDEASVLQLRQQEAVPVLDALGKWMIDQYQYEKIAGPMKTALGYSISRWKELSLYTTNGKLNPDNNPVERSIRPMAIGRKNYLFAGSHEAAQRSAILYSILGTCKLHNINPFTYLKNTLERIAEHPVNRIHELLPQNWTPLQ